jgi:hypothetical protein
MCCIAEVAMLIFGIIATVTGKFSLTRGRVCRGASARFVGVVLIVAPLLAFGTTFAITAMKFAQKGVQSPEQLSPQDMREIENTAMITQLVLGGLALVTALGIALATAKPVERRPRRRDEEDDDRPRRRRDEDDESDDRPRRRDEEDDDRPRRRRPEDEDEDDRPRRRPRDEDDRPR